MGIGFHVSNDKDFDPNNEDQEVCYCSNSTGAAVLHHIGMDFDWWGKISCDEVCTIIDDRGLDNVRSAADPMASARIQTIYARCKAERDSMLYWG